MWQALGQLPKRVEELEARIAALEKALATPASKTGPKCPLCGERMKTTRVQDHPQFGVFGHKLHTLACAGCGHEESRKVVPED